MPFGLKNAAQTFQRFIDAVLREFSLAYAYIDDILIASKTNDEHRDHVRVVLAKLAEVGLVINASK